MKNLNEITEDDAIEVAKIAMVRHNRHYQNEIKYQVIKIQPETTKSIFYAEIGIIVKGMNKYKVRLEKTDVCTSEWDFPHSGGLGKDFFTPNTFLIFQFLQSKGYDLPKYTDLDAAALG